MALPVPKAYEIQNWTLLASAARTGTSKTDAFQVDFLSSATIHVSVSNLTADASPTFRIWVQRLLPDNSTWTGIAKFAEVTTSTASLHLHFVNGGNTLQTTTTVADATVLTVNFGAQWRIFWGMTGTGTTEATFAVYGDFRH